MRASYAFLAALSLSLTQRAGANIFYLRDQWRGNDFFQSWNWETKDDPTHGRVNYVGLDEARGKNLAYGNVFVFPSPDCGTFSAPCVRVDSHTTGRATGLFPVDGDKFVMRADDWSIVDASARGRDSVRISSQTAYDEAILVLDLTHMPAGCATWPAFWTKSQAGPWPTGGEVDIIEGTHPPVSLHPPLSNHSHA